MKPARALSVTQAAALSVSVKAYSYRAALSVCLTVLLGYGIGAGHSPTGLFILSLLQVIFCADVVLKSAYQDICKGHFTLSVFTAVSVLSACAYNISKTFFLHPLAGAVPNIYLALAGMITCYLAIALYTVGHKENTQGAIKKLEEVLPKSGRLRKGKREMRVFARELRPADIVRVKAGETIPCEGTIVQGSSYIEESFITGNMLPAGKTIGSPVYAGTLNLGAEILVRVERALEESILAGIVRTIQQSQQQRCIRKNPLDRYALCFLIGAVLSAFAGYAVVYWAGNYVRPLHSLGILLLALGLGCPVSFFFAAVLPQVFLTIGAKRRRLVIHTLEALSGLEKADVIFLDKTGTLTQGKLSVQEICPAPKHTQKELLDCILSAEQMVDSPFALAVQQYAAAHQLKAAPVVCFEVYPGSGVRAQRGKEVLWAGRAAFLQQQGVAIKQVPQTEQAVICVAKDNVYIGYVTLADQLRTGWQEMIADIKKRQTELVLMSGDTQASVQAIAAQTGIEKINFGVLPQTKAEILANYKALGKKTVMIGDGFNDMSALLRADTGIVFACGKNVYNHWVDIVINRPDLQSITELFGLHKRLKNTVRSNVLGSFLYNIVLLAALIGLPADFWQRWFVLPLALLISVLILCLNSMRLLRIK